MATVLGHRFKWPAAVPEDSPRTILHVDLDCFFVSVERVLNPSLAQLPVIVGGLPEARGVVTSASREARAMGVHAGMASAVAQRLCPEATFLPGRGRLYARAAAAAQRILREFSARVERSSIDEAYLDLTDTVSGSMQALDVAVAIQQALAARLGLPSSLGLGSNKLVAKVACSRAKPEGIVEVWPGYERAFLGPLAVGELPGVGPVLEERLRLFGLRSVSDVARVDPALLEATFGATGRRLADMAHGVDEAAMTVDETPQSISREQTFATDVREPDRLVDEVYVLSGTVSARLRNEHLRARTITLKLKSADFKTLTRSRTLSVPTDDPSEIGNVACFLLREAHRGEPVRLVGVQASALTDEPRQANLFEATSAGLPEVEPAAEVTPAVLSLTPPLREARFGGLTLRWRG